MTNGPPRRRDRLVREREHDPYRSDLKLAEPTVCCGCGAVYEAGRWTWNDRPHGAYEGTCPACRRERDHYPAGYVTLTGAFVTAHSWEILGLVRNLEAKEKAVRPLNRLLEVEKVHDGMVITTTDMHLARALGDALHHAYDGDLDYDYVKGADVLRVTWCRD